MEPKKDLTKQIHPNVLTALEYSDYIFRVAFSYVGNGADAEDIRQEVFLSVLKNPGSYDSAKSKFITWLQEIILNKIRDFYRCKARKPHFNQGNFIPSEIRNDYLGIPQSPSPEFRAFTNEERERVFSVLEKLTSGERFLLISIYSAGDSYLELAKILGIPCGTIKSRLYAAKNRFKKFYGQVA